MMSDESRSESSNLASSEKKLEEAKKILASLILTRKHFSLYPEEHTICMNALDNLQRMTGMYLGRHGNLRFEIEKDRILSLGEVLISEPLQEGTLSFTLFRDGIRWLEFSEGIDTAELKTIISIINRYSILTDKSDSDIVTAFWESRLAHMKYEVADFSWADSQDTVVDPASDSENSGYRLLHNHMSHEWVSRAGIPIDQTALELTSDEILTVQSMIRHEEESSPTAYLDALFDSLLQYREQENFKLVITVAEEEYRSSISRKDMAGVLNILKGLQHVLGVCKADGIPKAVQDLEEFFFSLSRPQLLSLFKDVWHEIHPGTYEDVRRIFAFLRPEAIPVLCDLLQLSQSPQKQQLVLDAVIPLASQDMRSLEALLKKADEKLVHRLVQVFVAMKGDQPFKVLMSLMHHPTERVREEALKGIFQSDSSHIQDIFTLIDDKDKSVRRLVLKHMGQSRNQAAEKLLLNYLEHKMTKNTDSEHVIACFTALGQCGSIRSIPFLRRTMFEKVWLPTSSDATQKKGAIIALDKIGTKEARQVLDDAKRSLYPAVRQAMRKIYR